MPDNPTTALVKTSQSPALARVSNQLALTEKLLTNPEEPFLIPYRKGNKWGYCDRNKNIVIDCVYDSAHPFREGLAVTNFGYINLKGEIAFDLKKLNIYSICEFYGQASIVEESLTKKWGIINKNGELLTQFKYRNIIPPSEDIFIAEPSGIYDRIYLIDINGKEICVNKVDSINNFHESYAVCRKGEKVGFISKDGNFVIEPKYNRAHGFQFGLAAVDCKIPNKEGYGWNYIDKAGNQVISNYLRWATKFWGNYAFVSFMGEDFFSLINKNGDRLHSFTNYKWISSISRGFAIAFDKNDLTFDYLNHQGEKIYSDIPKLVASVLAI